MGKLYSYAISRAISRYHIVYQTSIEHIGRRKYTILAFNDAVKYFTVP